MMLSRVDFPHPLGPIMATNDADKFAFSHFEVDVFESLCLDLFGAVYLVDIREFDYCHNILMFFC